MFGFKRKRRFEKAVSAEVSYLLAVHGEPDQAMEAAQARAARPNIPDSRIRIHQAAAANLGARVRSR